MLLQVRVRVALIDPIWPFRKEICFAKIRFDLCFRRKEMSMSG